MLNSPNQDADASASLNVGECPHCQTLFVIPTEADGTTEAQESSLLCPACEAELSQAAMRPRTLPVARLAPAPPVLEIPVSEVPAPETLVSETLAPELPSLEMPASPVGLAGSSLLGGLIPPTTPLGEVATLAENTVGDSVPQAKKSLSETLGWTPSEFTPQASPVETTGPVETTEPVAPTNEMEKAPYEPLPGNATLPDTTAPTLSDFRFDFGKDSADSPQPLEEEVLAEVPAPFSEELSSAETLEYGAEDFVSRLANTADSTAGSAVDEVASGVEWSPSQDALPTSSQKKSWLGPLSAVAGLMVVGIPAGYFALTGFDSNAILNVDLAGENRELRAEITKEEMPPAPFAMQDKGVVSAAALLPKKKTEGVSTASFESAPAVPATKRPEKMDRYTNNASAKSGRYSNNRYALQSSSEPNPFAAANATAMDDLPAAGQPIALEPTTLEPAVEPQSSRLIGAPAYGFETLLQAVTEAAPAGTAFAEGSLANEEEVPAMGQHYARLCYLAQVLTLMDPVASHPDLMTQEFEAVDLFKRLFRNAGAREDSRQIAGPWMTWSGRPHGGVFFAGIPNETRKAGELFEYRFPVADGEVYVVTEKPIDARRFLNSKANEVGVIGIVVEDPETRIAGYEGSAERVIWARKTAPLPPARDAQ